MVKSAELAEGDRKRRRRSRGTRVPADWASADPQLVLNLIAAVASAGGAVRFGYTRQGDAYSVGYLGDGDPYTEFVRPTDDLAAYLVEVTKAWDGEAPN